jgi:hypothetical protein
MFKISVNFLYGCKFYNIKKKKYYVTYVNYGYVEGPGWGMILMCLSALLKVQGVKFRKLVSQEEIFIITI